MTQKKNSIYTRFMHLRLHEALGLVLAFAMILATPLPFAVGQSVLPPEYQALVPQEIKDQIQLLSGNSMFIAAKALGITKVAGKSLEIGGGPPGSSNSKLIKDVPIAADPIFEENEPTVVANPKDKFHLVAGYHRLGSSRQIAASLSHDAGQTWSGPISMPALTPNSEHSNQVLAFAPDGSRVYNAYMDIKFIFTPKPHFTLSIDFDIVVSYSDDGGISWTGPIMALDGLPTVITFKPFRFTPGFIYDKPWIRTPIDDNSGNWVYITASRFDQFPPFNSHIAFTRSSDKAVSWSAPTPLDTVAFGPFPGVIVQGSRPAGGMGGNVIVAWYHSDADGFLTGKFKIRTRYSTDHGASWNPVVDASTDAFEAPFFLGPFAFYHRWWPTMFPDVEIDSGGAAHIVYTHDPDQNGPFTFDPDDIPIPPASTTPEDGDIRYISSSGPPYSAWTAPITLNDDGLKRAQGFAAIETQHGGEASTLHVIWEDHRLSPEAPAVFPDSSNLFYDIFYTRKVPGEGVGWTSNLRVSEASSISDFIFIGDYNDLVANDVLVLGAWTDRRHQSDIFALEDNVFGSRIIGGGAAAPALVRLKPERTYPNVLKAQGHLLSNQLPNRTLVHQNHPNPFNPETWIPYQLADSAAVTLRIYEASGKIVRTLSLSKKDAGWYMTKERAAHWDGRNEAGEPVTSGIYFYEFTAGNFRSLKKMVILK